MSADGRAVRRCIRMWRIEQAGGHPRETCCHTTVFQRIVPNVNSYERQIRDDAAEVICGPAPHVIRTDMDAIGCSCLQENMHKSDDHMHEYMFGNKTDILLGAVCELPPRLCLTNVYLPVLPMTSSSILGTESFYSPGGLPVFHFYPTDVLVGLLLVAAIFAVVTPIVWISPRIF